MSQQDVSGFRLSPQQQRVWFLQQRDQHPYRSQGVITIAGVLDSTALQRAVEHTIVRHEILHTTFQVTGDEAELAQVIMPAAPIKLPQLDLRDQSPEHQAAAIARLGEQQRRQPFSLEQGPLLDLLLVTVAADRHLLLLCLSALIGDAATLRQLSYEIGAAYGSAQSLDADDEPMQYADIAAWQIDILDSEQADAGKLFWQAHRQTTVARFPGELAAAPDAAFSPALVQRTLAAAERAAVIEAARQANVSVESLLLASWILLLRRRSDSAETSVGVACHGRTYEDLAQALGLLTKYLPLRVAIDDASICRELIASIAATQQEAQDWQEFFEWSEASDAPFYPACFSYDAAPSPVLVGEVSFTLSQVYACTDRFKLKLACLETESDLALELHYDTAAYDSATVERLLDGLHALITDLTVSIDRPVHALRIIAEAERAQLLEGFNQTGADYRRTVCLHELLEEQAARAPDAPAVVLGDQSLTFSALNQQANQLAHYLRGNGVGPDVVVGLCVERSPAMIVALFGILKAGGAYLPLDPQAPRDRLALILGSAGVSLVVTQQHLHDRLAAEQLTTICLDRDQAAIAASPTTEPQSGVSAENLAYVLYTSGSTGVPKGVCATHRSVVNFANGLSSMVFNTQHTPPRRVSLNAQMTFDASLKQLVQMLYGHTLVIIPAELRLDAPGLRRYVAEQRLDVFDCTPLHLRQLAAHGLLDDLDGRPGTILVGGDRIEPSFWQAMQQDPQREFFNSYGPTETTVNAMICRIKTADAEPTIGRPLANTQIYLLDRHMQPVPLGLPGEIYIGGDGLARGYLNRPDLTAERFVPHPFATEPGQRLYKTGDLGQYHADGTILFLGRTDFQIKIRGQRVELGEIEACVKQHPAVQEAAVVVREDQRGDAQLIGYVVLRTSDQPAELVQSDSSSIQGYLRDKLPEYMLPSALVFLEKLPMTASGKVDRQALLALAQVPAQNERPYVAPETAIEQQIAALWQEVLGVERVGIQDNFFDLGGDSLRIIQAHSQLQAQGYDVAVVDLFTYPTIQSLAQHLSSKDAQTAAPRISTEQTQELRQSRSQRRQMRQSGRTASSEE